MYSYSIVTKTDDLFFLVRPCWSVGGTSTPNNINNFDQKLNIGSAEYQKIFSNKTKAIVWGMQTRAVQSMLDFDFICR